MEWRATTPPRLVVILVLGNLLMAAAHVIEAFVPHSIEGLRNQLDMGLEGNVSTWYASAQWGAAAILAGIWAHGAPASSGRRLPLYLPAAGLTAFSLDEVARIHEWIGEQTDVLLPGGDRSGTMVPETGVWMFVLFPILAVAVASVAWLVRDQLRDAPRAVLLLIVGGGWVVLGAGLLELASNLAVGQRLAYSTVVMLEETAELMGATTVIWAMLELLRSAGIGLRSSRHRW